MKKLIAIILTLSFILALVPFAFSVSAAETHLSGSGKGWKTTRGGGVFYTDADREIYWKAGADGKTYEWPVVHSGSLTNGVITATMSASGNVGIFFGGDGIEANVKDGDTSSLLGATDVRYSWVAIEVDPSTGAAKLAYFYDDETAAGTNLTNYRKSWLPLNDTTANAEKFGIDGSSDIELKVSFNEKGKMKAYVNGALVTGRESGFVPFGGEYGIITRNTSYGSEKANSEVGYIKSFSATEGLDGLNEEWVIRRGGTSWAASAGNEFDVLFVSASDGARTYSNLAQYYKNLEEGTVTATVGAGSRIGIAFAGTGFENVFEGSGGSLTQVENLMYYQAVLDYEGGDVKKLYVALKVDSSATSDVTSNTPTEIEKVYLSSNSLIDNDYTLTVTFTKAGDIKIYFNGEEYISVTGQTIYGSDLGMVTTGRGPLDVSKVGTVAATVKDFHICEPTLVPAVAANCQTEGNIEHYACFCGKLYSDAAATLEITEITEPINANNHAKTTQKYDEEAHWDECDACQAVMNKALHDIDANALEGECSGCDYAKVHTCELTFVQGTPATCMATGIVDHYKCNNASCGKTYSDAEGTQQIIDLTAPVDINNHTEVLSYDFDEDGHWQICECETVFSLPADHEYENGVDGDCTVCDYYKVPVHVCAPATHVEGREANCCISGIVEHWICECGKYYLDEDCTIPTTANDIDFDADLSDIANHVIILDETEWSYGSDHHWKACACGEKFEYAEHDDLYCTVCDFYKTGVYYDEAKDGYYFLEYTGKLLTGKFYVTQNASNGLVEAGWYYADESGKFYNKEVVEIDGKLYYFENGQGANGIHLVDGSYYCSLWTGEVRTGKIYVTDDSTNGLEGFKSGWYYTDENGAFYDKAFVEIAEEDATYYFEKGQGISNGVHLITVEEVEKFFCFDHRGRLRTGKFYITMVSTNGIEGFNGWHTTDESGAIID